MKRYIIFILLLFVSAIWYESGAQVLTEEAARAEIRKRGLDEEEVIKEIEKRGVKLDEIDVNDPAELARAEKVVREVIAEMEAAKNGTTSSGGSSPPDGGAAQSEVPIEELDKEESKEAAKEDEEVVDAIEEGASLEEAVAETLQENAKEKLPPTGVYGKDLFRNNVIKEYRRAENVKAPGTYILGPGDKVAINIWGISEYSGNLEINNEGYIKPDRMPRIYLNGLSIDQAKEKLRSSFSRYFRFDENSFDVTLSVARTITVNIVGEVENPGSYTISALNTAFNALVAAGGPNNIGSVRNIQLLRGGEVLKVDVYEYLKNPTVSQNFYLQDNSYINVPVAEKVVSISGAIRRPMRYELKESEGLNEVINYAGGLKETAIQRNIQIERVENDRMVLIDVPYSELISSGNNFKLISSDKIKVFTIPESYDNIVSLSGAFIVPGKYAYEEGMRVSDLLSKTEFQQGAILDSAYLKRINKDNITWKYYKIDLSKIINDTQSEENILLQPRDEIIVKSISQYVDGRSVSIVGEVRNEGEYRIDNEGSLKLSDLVFLSGGLKEGADSIAYLVRQNKKNPLKREYIRINIIEAINNVDGPSNILLKGMDELRVFSKARYLDGYSIKVLGAVRFPGEYPVDETGKLKISDVVKLSGGLLPDTDEIGFVFRYDPSNPYAKEYLRVNVRNAVNNSNSLDNIFLKAKDELVLYSKTRYLDQFSVSISGAVRSPGEFQFDPSLSMNDLIKLAGGLKMEASPSRVEVYRVKIVRGEKTEILAASLQLSDDGELIDTDLELQPYDKVFVRTVPEFELQRMVTIQGEVKYPGPYAILDDNEKLASLINRAGGLTNEAFLGGSSLFRSLNDVGYIVLDFEEALDNNSSPENVIVQEGDLITIPKKERLVTIVGATKASELYPDEQINGGIFTIPYVEGKNAKFYIDEYAGGIAENGDAGKVSVYYANGEVKKSGRFLFWRTYPEVREGSEIRIGIKDVEPEKPESEKEESDVDWGEVLSDSVAQAMSVLTLVLLLQRID